MSAVATARGRFEVHRGGNAAGPPLVLVGGLSDDHGSRGGVRPRLEPHYDCMEQIKVPTLQLGGSEDLPTRPELTRRMAERLPRAQVAWLPTGHMTFWEQPDAWAQRVRQFLDDTGDAR